MVSTSVDSQKELEPIPPKTPVLQRLGRIVGEVVLTLAALAGLCVTVLTVTAARSGVEPLVVRSGSMEPTILTGSMVLTKRVEAEDIRLGDIVTVKRPDGTRATHRVIGLERTGDAVRLTLKGDANEAPDPEPVTVQRAQRLMLHIPNVGRVMAWSASAQGGFVIGCVVTAFITRVMRSRARARDA
ncbi:MAG: signal peptidase I [Actinomycetota bacterium]|nr:signal peptidase I [Actinomycetota bacterium]